MNLTAGIITKNEEDNISDCINSIKDIADEVIVVDDYSNDKTEAIASSLGARVYKRRLDNFSAQKNYLISKAMGKWVFVIDADERADDILRQEIKKALLEDSCGGFSIFRKNFIFGKYLKYGGNGNDWVVRLFRKESARFINDVHEKPLVDGKICRIEKGAMNHYSTPDLSSYVRKLNIYTDIESEDLRKRRFLLLGIIFIPPSLFIRRYILQRGFLDGMEGFIYAVLSSVYSFIKYAKAIF